MKIYLNTLIWFSQRSAARQKQHPFHQTLPVEDTNSNSFNSDHSLKKFPEKNQEFLHFKL